MEYPCKKGTPAKPEKNSVFPTAKGKKKNPSMDKKLFNYEGNKIDGSKGYGKSGKGATVNKSVASSKKNTIAPTSDY
jgi:hypothetical protein